MIIEAKKVDGRFVVTGAPKHVDVSITESPYGGWRVRARYVAYSAAIETEPLRLPMAIEAAVAHLKEFVMNDADGPVNQVTAIGDIVKVAPFVGLRFSHNGHVGTVVARNHSAQGFAVVRWESGADLPPELPFEFFANAGIVPL